MANVLETSKIDLLKGYKRLSGFALDDTCVAVTYSDALEYSRTSLAYVGQIIVVLNDDNPAEDMVDFKNTTIPYMIDYSKNLVPLNRDAYFSRKEILTKIDNLITLVNTYKTELLYTISTYKYVNNVSANYVPVKQDTEVIVDEDGNEQVVGKVDENGNPKYNRARIEFNFNFGNNETIVLKQYFDVEYFDLYEGETTWTISFNKKIKDRINQITTNELDIDQLQLDLANEIARAILTETNINDKLDTEIQTRTNADISLNNRVDTEIKRATTAEANIQQQIDSNDVDISGILEHNIEQDIKLDNRLQYSDLDNKPSINDHYVKIKDADVEINIATKNSITFTNERPISSTIGGLQSNTNVANKDTLEILNTIIRPYVAPELYFSSIRFSNTNNNSYKVYNISSNNYTCINIDDLANMNKIDNIVCNIIKRSSDFTNVDIDIQYGNITSTMISLYNKENNSGYMYDDLKESANVNVLLNKTIAFNNQINLVYYPILSNLLLNTEFSLNLIAKTVDADPLNIELNGINKYQKKCVITKPLTITKLNIDDRLDRDLTNDEINNITLDMTMDNINALWNNNLQYSGNLNKESLIIISPVELKSIKCNNTNLELINTFYMQQNNNLYYYYTDPITGSISLAIYK